jgi:hypothetical protein
MVLGMRYEAVGRAGQVMAGGKGRGEGYGESEDVSNVSSMIADDVVSFHSQKSRHRQHHQHRYQQEPYLRPLHSHQ